MSGGTTPWAAKPAATWPWEDPARRGRIVLVVGESRGANNTEDTGACDLVLSAKPQSPDRCLMMNNQRAPGLLFELDFTGEEASALIPLRDCRFGNRGFDGYIGTAGDPLGQSLSAMALYLDAADAAAGRPLRRTYFVVVGVGGRMSHEIIKGAAPFTGSFWPGNPKGQFVIYDRALRAITRIRDLSRRDFGQEVSVDWVLLLQGVNDLRAVGGPTPANVWRDRIEQSLIRAHDLDLPAITGQTTPIYTLFEQSFAGFSGEPLPPALGQADMADRNLNGRTHLAMVSYQMPMNNRDLTNAATGHNTSRGSVLQGEMFGRAAATIADGGTPRRCKVIAHSVVGNQVIIEANRPLVVNTTRFPDPGTLGCNVRAGAGSAVTVGGISSVTVNGRWMVVTLPGPPASGLHLDYAYEFVGGQQAGVNTGALWTNGEVDLSGITPRTAGAWGVVVAADRAEAAQFVSGMTIYDALETFQRQVA